MGDRAIPPNVNLAKTTPEAVESYSRRFKSIANNAQVYNEQAYVNITLDTSTPGSYIDVLQSYLKFDLTLINTNPFIDFASFGSAGANAVIEEFRIYCQGTPVEEILYYNDFVECLMDLHGLTTQPMDMFVPSCIRQPVSQVHSVNAIKAPMVNLAGSAMHMENLGSNVFRSSYSSYWSNSFGANQPYTLLGTTAPFSYELNYGTALSVQSSEIPSVGNGGNSSPAMPTQMQGYFTANVNAASVIQGMNTITPIPQTIPAGSTYVNPSTNLTNAGFLMSGAWPQLFQAGANSAVNPNIAPTMPFKQPEGIVFGACNYFFNSNPDYDASNPLNWPFVMPNGKEIGVRKIIPDNLQDYMMYLSNVKNIPVGIPGQARPVSGSQSQADIFFNSTYDINSINFMNVAPLSSITYSSTYTCCIPLVSGVLGAMAEKAFPSSLVAPGSYYIQLRLASNLKALKISMDPLRRVLGTVRDYVPFGGSIGSLFGAYSYGGFASVYDSDLPNYPITTPPTMAAVQGTSASALWTSVNNGSQTTSCYGFFNAGVQTATVPSTNCTQFAPSGQMFDSLVGNSALFTDYDMTALTVAQDASYVRDKVTANASEVPGQGVTVNHPVLGNPASVIGANLMAIQARLNATNQNANISMIFSPYSISAMEGTWTTINFVEGEVATTLSGHNLPGKNWGDLQSHTWLDSTTPFLPSTASVPLIGVAKIYGPDRIESYTGSGGTDTGDSVPFFPFQTQLNAGYQAAANCVNVNGVVPIIANPTNNTTGVLTNGAVDNGALATTLAFSDGRSGWANGTLPPGQPSGLSPAQPTSAPTVGQFKSHTRLQMNPAGIPMPQYMLVKTPWNKKEFKATFTNGATKAGSNVPYQTTGGASAGFPWAVAGSSVAAGDLAPEYIGCYGTFLEHSKAQALRCFSCGASNNVLSYQLSNVEFVGMQIVLPTDIATTILQQATHGDISISTTTAHVYLTGVQEGTTQNIIIPAKIASANWMINIFQPTNFTSQNDAQLYNSLSRFCPYSKISSSGTPNVVMTSQILGNAPTTGIGSTVPLNIINAPAKFGSFEVQLKIGNELIPQQPYGSISEIIAEIQKAKHSLFDMTANTNTQFSLTTASSFISTNPGVQDNSGANFSGINGLYYDCLCDGEFTTAFTPAVWLDDQTFINNPNWNYIAACASLPLNTTTSPASNPLFGVRNPYILPFFLPAESRFMLAFDLDTWSKFSDVTKSGKYLGNNTIQLYMTGCVGFNEYAKSCITGMNMKTIILHESKLSFQAGGSMVAYY
jgi:hypothetical protein